MGQATGRLRSPIITILCLLLLTAALAAITAWADRPRIVRRKQRVDVAPDQSFSGAAGSTIDYNVYIENDGSSMETYTLTASSSQGYIVEVWRDTDQLNGGDVQLIPPQGCSIALGAGEVATMIVRTTIPLDAVDGTTDTTMVEAVSTSLGISDSVSLSTTIDSGLPYFSDWIQLGSDLLHPSRPDKTDVKALYYTNNGTHVFFRMAEADAPDAKAFVYTVYLDTRAGGEQIGSDRYDTQLGSDGILYVWNGTNWVNSGYPTYQQTDGTSIVLWVSLDSLNLTTQDIHVLARTATKDGSVKDEVGSYTILRDNISEMPLLLLPLVALAIYLSISKRRDGHSYN
jgi:hypothetical protein